MKILNCFFRFSEILNAFGYRSVWNVEHENFKIYKESAVRAFKVEFSFTRSGELSNSFKFPKLDHKPLTKDKIYDIVSSKAN